MIPLGKKELSERSRDVKRLIVVGIIILSLGSGCSALKKTWGAITGKERLDLPSNWLGMEWMRSKMANTKMPSKVLSD